MHCCFFHFTANVRKNSKPVMAAIKRTVGQNSVPLSFAEKTKRSMMLPLMPEELISTDRSTSWSLGLTPGSPSAPGRLVH